METELTVQAAPEPERGWILVGKTYRPVVLVCRYGWNSAVRLREVNSGEECIVQEHQFIRTIPPTDAQLRAEQRKERKKEQDENRAKRAENILMALGDEAKPLASVAKECGEWRIALWNILKHWPELAGKVERTEAGWRKQQTTN